MAASSIPHRWKYDVFVSFRGEDIRKNFMDHMFNGFKQKGIHAFRDDNELPKGEEISPHLYKAIEESRFLIVIFSKDYASSSWCLRELVKILKCKQIENPKYEVRIIFYDVKPDVVRKQTGSYAEALAKHERSNNTKVDIWKDALSMAANLSGWNLADMTNGYESKFIDCVCKEILVKLCNGALHVGEDLVGIDIHFDKIDLSRFIRLDKVKMIGICGISGIGKTTLAKAIYNMMYIHFEGSCFCDDVQGVSKRLGITQVQMQLIDDIMKTRDVKISNIGQGIMAIKKMMSSKPVLLVLDDVDHREQLEALAGSASWFFPGSLIIFTGKEKQLLRSHRVDIIHDMDFLGADESLKLFSSYAFEGKHPSRGFEELAEKAVKYVQGHPLALKVLGCFLYSKTVSQWVSELDWLKVHPNEEIQRVFRLSYDGLNLHQQNILLDIACLFIGENSEFVASILDGCNFFADTNMRVLVDKSLITISSKMSLQMHDLIQAMAREIVHDESIFPGKQRRLCISSEVYNVSSNKKVAITDAVEVLVLLLETYSQKVHIDATDFAHMKKLRILKIYQKDKFAQESELKSYNVIFSGSFDFLSSELRLFCWHGFPFKYLPSDFYPENIVAIDLSYSNIKKLWTTPKGFRRLKVMNLRHCCNLTSTPDFSEIRNLEELSLEGCVNLVTIHPSIRMLNRLVYFNIKNCERLSFLSNKKMDKLPEGLGRIKTSGELHIDGTAIAESPSFVRSLTNLVYLSLGQCVKNVSRWWTTSIFQSFIGLDGTAKAELPSKQLHPKKFHDGPLHVGENIVHVNVLLDKLKLSRFVGSNKVNMIGICGISGIGKTTLAKAIYNLMYIHFEGGCFCEAVSKHQDLTQVQMQLVDDIMKTRELEISNVGQGIMVIKQRISCKPVLLVLDDVDGHDQLEALAGSPTWFCPGSLIIFTSKDKQLLRSHRVEEIHELESLDEEKSLKLFYSYAFDEKNPSTGFEKLAEDAVKFVHGHPLSLKVLGQCLYGTTVNQWISELDRLRVDPNGSIERVVRLSYDRLNLDQQNILLDIACSFIGVKYDFAASILDGCNLFAHTNMRVLVDKSLITTSSNMSLQMHDLIQAMAREIVREEFIMTGNRSRLWGNPSEIYNILSEKKGTQAVEILDLLQMRSSQKFDIDGTAFAQMKNLRILKLPADDLVNFSGRLEFLSNKLRLLCWHGCPFKVLPTDFYPENIVSIDLSYSHIQDFWTTPLCFRRLKLMNLSYCHNLTSTPNFTNATNLQELIIEGCKNLVNLHPSIRMLKKLVVLNMRNCKHLKLDDQTSFVWC